MLTLKYTKKAVARQEEDLLHLSSRQIDGLPYFIVAILIVTVVVSGA